MVDKTPTRFGICALVLVYLVAATVGEARAQGLEERAQAYATSFMTGSFEELNAQHDGAMKAAFDEARLQEILTVLTAQNGTVRSIGQAWYEDDLQGYHRYRVPVEFSSQTIDMRLVFNGDGTVAGLFFLEHVAPPPSDASAPGTETDVLVGDETTGLPGTLLIPEGPGPFPAAILVHGSGPSDRDETTGPNKIFRDIAWGLAEHGIATLRYDKRSYVRPHDLIDRGDDLTVKDEVIYDARAALDLIRDHPSIDGNKLFVIGHSLGGTVAPRIARIEPRPAGVIILAGATLPLPEKMLAQTRYIAAIDGVMSDEERARIEEMEQTVALIRRTISSGAELPGNHLGVPIAYYRDLESNDPVEITLENRLPVLVMQGARDYQVTFDDFKRWEDGLKGRRFVCLLVFEKLDHMFRPGKGPTGPSDYDLRIPVDPEVINAMSLWINDGTCPE